MIHSKKADCTLNNPGIASKPNNMTKFKDVAHLYLGCEVKSPFMGKNQKLCGVSKILMPEGHYELDPVIEFNCNGRYEVRPTIWGGVKPLLRPLGSMTKDEKVEYAQQRHKYNTGNPASHITTDWAYKVCWLIEHHFDLFSLIPNGEAIDKTKI